LVAQSLPYSTHDDFNVAAVLRVNRAQPRRFLLLDHPRDRVPWKLIELVRQPMRQEFYSARPNVAQIAVSRSRA
jgi:hypothetical protein